MDPFQLTARDLEALLVPGAPNLPELEVARQDKAALFAAPQTRIVLAQTQGLVDPSSTIPQTTYSDYRLFRETGDRSRYESAYFGKRAALADAALRLFFGAVDFKPLVQDLLWSICEESNWVLPAHEGSIIDLFAAETAFDLAETLDLLRGSLDPEIRARVRGEVERRVFEPYLRYHDMHWWYRAGMNWNGVCNSSVAAAFLLLEPEPGRVAQAIEIALNGLDAYLTNGFETDGASTEGVSYWHYGLINLIAMAEMLRARTGGALDLLDTARMCQIAGYPAKLRLSPMHFASFSDCDAEVYFSPGIMARLAERTGETSVRGLIRPVASGRPERRLTMMLRSILWWDGVYSPALPLTDAHLSSVGIARLTSSSPDGEPVVLAVKAGHNDENHNHDDIGSFILHIGDETLLADPGRGLYTRDYFNARRYENIFANSYGHSVPRLGGQMQKTGKAYRGELTSVDGGDTKRAEIEMAGAYGLAQLSSARRQLTLGRGAVTLCDRFLFSDLPVEVEEAFVTWCDVQTHNSVALLRGQRHTLQLSLEAPAGATFAVERLEKTSKENGKAQVLSRISATLPVGEAIECRVRMEIIATD